MKTELCECIISEELYIDLNDDHIFKKSKISELITESKIVVFAPNYLIQVTSKDQLINLIDLAIYLRNLSFFILIMF